MEKRKIEKSKGNQECQRWMETGCGIKQGGQDKYF